MTNIIQFPKKIGSNYFKSRITSASKPDFVKTENSAEIILMMTPDDPNYIETKLTILAAHYWARIA